MSQNITLPYVIHIVGTNGKGSTGRFLSSILTQHNQTVLHYSSPHISKFNERIWINGQDVNDNNLNIAHEKLQTILDNDLLEKLTYFEYTTLLGILLSDKLDYLVLEAGLGGEFDATNVVTNDISIITTIGLDHQNFLGDTIELISATKMRSCDNQYILSNQLFHEVYTVKNNILATKQEIQRKEYKLTSEAKNLPLYLQNNLQTALSVLDFLGFANCTYQLPQIPGRFQYFRENIIIDVGHNPLAATAIAQELEKTNKKFSLIYNSYADKNYDEVLKILKPYINEIQIINCDDKRMVEKNKLLETIDHLSIMVNDFNICGLDIKKNYLVFGSFIVVENFLKRYNEI